jgi:hypothetical protein
VTQEEIAGDSGALTLRRVTLKDNEGGPLTTDGVVVTTVPQVWPAVRVSAPDPAPGS